MDNMQMERQKRNVNILTFFISLLWLALTMGTLVLAVNGKLAWSPLGWGVAALVGISAGWLMYAYNFHARRADAAEEALLREREARIAAETWQATAEHTLDRVLEAGYRASVAHSMGDTVELRDHLMVMETLHHTRKGAGAIRQWN